MLSWREPSRSWRRWKPGSTRTSVCLRASAGPSRRQSVRAGRQTWSTHDPDSVHRICFQCARVACASGEVVTLCFAASLNQAVVRSSFAFVSPPPGRALIDSPLLAYVRPHTLCSAAVFGAGVGVRVRSRVQGSVLTVWRMSPVLRVNRRT